MTGICISTGEYKWIGKAAADRMGEMTGLDCIIIDEVFCEVPHPSWIKAKLIDHFPEIDSFLVFDSDIICLQPWQPEALFEELHRPFMAVPDDRSNNVLHECVNLEIPFPDFYVNGGLTIFGREHKPVWDAVWKCHPKCGRWLEQGALNLALLETGVEVCRLPRRFNYLAHGGTMTPQQAKDLNIVNYHACSIGNAIGVREVQERFGLYDHHKNPTEPTTVA
jgi:hypothetical protein